MEGHGNTGGEVMRSEIAMPSSVRLSVSRKKTGLMLVGVSLAKPWPGSDEPPVLVAVHLHKAFMCGRFSLPSISHHRDTECIATGKYFEL